MDGFEVWSKGLGPTDKLYLIANLYGEKNSEVCLIQGLLPVSKRENVCTLDM